MLASALGFAFVAFSVPAVRSAEGPPASPASVTVNASVAGQGMQAIGTMVVDDHADDAGNFMTATFELNDAFAYLDAWYNFRWINVVTDYTVNGNHEDYDGDGNNDMPQFDFPQNSPPFMEIPAIDPVPGPFVGGMFYNDDAPFYFTDAEHDMLAADGEAAPYSDSRGTHSAGTVITFKTYLCAESESDDSITASTVCILAGFEWTSTGPGGGGPNPPGNAEALVATIPAPGAGDVTAMDTALANAGEDHMDNGTADDGDFAGWSSSTGCSFSECPSVTDCIFTSIPLTTFSESSWTLNGVEIGKTFEGGISPLPGQTLYETTYLPSEPNDWHWSVTFPWQEMPRNLSVSVVNFSPGDQIGVEVVCSPFFLDLLLQIDIGFDQYQLFDGPNLIHNGQWSAYPLDLPPSQGFTPAGLARANFVILPGVTQVVCAGDGSYPSSSATICPCGNTSAPGSGEGCVNSGATSGGTLRDAPGSTPSFSADALQLDATHPPSNSGLLLVNDSIFPVGSAVFDGLACVGGGPRALPGADNGMVQPFGDVDAVPNDGVRNMGGTAPGSGLYGLVNATFPGYFAPGGTYYAQFWYRDVLCGPPPAPCNTVCTNPPPAAANFTNAVTWTVSP